MPLSPDEVRAIYAKRRTKGLYDSLLVEFLEVWRQRRVCEGTVD